MKSLTSSLLFFDLKLTSEGTIQSFYCNNLTNLLNCLHYYSHIDNNIMCYSHVMKFLTFFFLHSILYKRNATILYYKII